MGRQEIIVVGAGLAGMSATLESVRQGAHVTLFSWCDWCGSSVMAEGGINAALDGEGDSVDCHAQDTLAAARGLASETAVRNMTQAAPDIVAELYDLGVQFSSENGRIAQRLFGGQSKPRTCYAKEATGRQMVSALSDEVRRLAAQGDVDFHPHSAFAGLLVENGVCVGCVMHDSFEDVSYEYHADAVIMATGGLAGLFEEATASSQNTGDASALLFVQGVAFSNLEFIQYHPTTVKMGRRRILISESARSAGGRLCVLRDGEPFYFLEENHPTLGRGANLLPRDVLSREMFACRREGQVYLDLRGVDEKAYKGLLSDTLQDCQVFLKVDPTTELLPVEPGVHYFMGGIQVDVQHRTSLPGLYAAGECCAQYHGANRIGGNSLLGALYGGKVAGAQAVFQATSAGRVAAQTAPDAIPEVSQEEASGAGVDAAPTAVDAVSARAGEPETIAACPYQTVPSPFYLTTQQRKDIQRVLSAAMSIERTAGSLAQAAERLSASDTPLGLLACAMVKCALAREESRGAHFRRDFPEEDARFEKVSVARMHDGDIEVSFEEVLR